MAKSPTNLTLSPAARRLGADLVRQGGFDSLTELIESLLRRKHDRMFGKATAVPTGQAQPKPNGVHISNFPVQKLDNSNPKKIC